MTNYELKYLHLDNIASEEIIQEEGVAEEVSVGEKKDDSDDDSDNDENDLKTQEHGCSIISIEHISYVT